MMNSIDGNGWNAKAQAMELGSFVLARDEKDRRTNGSSHQSN